MLSRSIKKSRYFDIVDSLVTTALALTILVTVLFISSLIFAALSSCDKVGSVLEVANLIIGTCPILCGALIGMIVIRFLVLVIFDHVVSANR